MPVWMRSTLCLSQNQCLLACWLTRVKSWVANCSIQFVCDQGCFASLILWIMDSETTMVLVSHLQQIAAKWGSNGPQMFHAYGWHVIVILLVSAIATRAGNHFVFYETIRIWTAPKSQETKWVFWYCIHDYSRLLASLLGLEPTPSAGSCNSNVFFWRASIGTVD